MFLGDGCCACWNLNHFTQMSTSKYILAFLRNRLSLLSVVLYQFTAAGQHFLLEKHNDNNKEISKEIKFKIYYAYFKWVFQRKKMERHKLENGL